MEAMTEFKITTIQFNRTSSQDSCSCTIS